MICVFVTFHFEAPPSAEDMRQIAEGARDRFVDLPGLRSKAFTVDLDRNDATNVYIWENEESARAFFTEERTQRVTALYGVRPTIRYSEVVALVDNAARRVEA